MIEAINTELCNIKTNNVLSNAERNTGRLTIL